MPMRALPLLLLPAVLAACTAAQPAASPSDDAETARLRNDVQRLRVENERLRRIAERPAVEADCPVPEEAYRGQTVEVLLSDLLFESGSADLTPGGLQRLDEVAARLKLSFAGRRVRVEGHTDTQPIGPTLRTQFPTNWELSTARATTVLRYLQEVHAMDPARLEAVGMGAYDPLESNATAEGRARNRRVRIAALPE
jgi:chemotaxis protein MotB